MRLWLGIVVVGTVGYVLWPLVPLLHSLRRPSRHQGRHQGRHRV